MTQLFNCIVFEIKNVDGVRHKIQLNPSEGCGRARRMEEDDCLTPIE